MKQLFRRLLTETGCTDGRRGSTAPRSARRNPKRRLQCGEATNSSKAGLLDSTRTDPTLTRRRKGTRIRSSHCRHDASGQQRTGNCEAILGRRLRCITVSSGCSQTSRRYGLPFCLLSGRGVDRRRLSPLQAQTRTRQWLLHSRNQTMGGTGIGLGARDPPERIRPAPALSGHREADPDEFSGPGAFHKGSYTK